MKLLDIALAFVIFFATWLGGHNVATAQEPLEDPCGFTIGQAQQITESGVAQAETPVICVSAPDVTLYAGGYHQIRTADEGNAAPNLLIFGNVDAQGEPVLGELYVQSFDANTVVHGSSGPDFLINYAGLGGTLYGNGGEDVIVADPVVLIEASAMISTPIAVRQFGGRGDDVLRAPSDATALLRGGRGADRIITPAKRGVVRGGPGRDYCKVRRTVETFGCERVVRW